MISFLLLALERRTFPVSQCSPGNFSALANTGQGGSRGTWAAVSQAAEEERDAAVNAMGADLWCWLYHALISPQEKENEKECRPHGVSLNTLLLKNPWKCIIYQTVFHLLEGDLLENVFLSSIMFQYLRPLGFKYPMGLAQLF